MHTKGFRYKKCTHVTVGTGNVNQNPGKVLRIVEEGKTFVSGLKLNSYVIFGEPILLTN
jgi:hypothetical protein